ncbi:2-(3-amino-3-carboxypropyl)histidine synthase subunit 1, partial [Bienertia sinuspersici]
YDPEIERTLRRIRKGQRKIQVDLEFDLEKLFKEEMSKLVGNESKDRVCGICSDLSHTTNACPTLKTEDVNALGGFPEQPQRKYDPFSPTYNEGWCDHPTLRYGPKPSFPQATSSSSSSNKISNLHHLGNSIIKEFNNNKRPRHIYKTLSPTSVRYALL